MAEHEKDFEVIEETTETVIEEKPGFFARAAETVSHGVEAVKAKGKYIAAGVLTAAAGTAIWYGVSAHMEQKRTREELAEQGLTIEDVPELEATHEAEFGPYAEA